MRGVRPQTSRYTTRQNEITITSELKLKKKCIKKERKEKELKGSHTFLNIAGHTNSVSVSTDDNIFVYYHNYTKICMVLMTYFTFLKFVKLTLLINYNKRYSSFFFSSLFPQP